MVFWSLLQVLVGGGGLSSDLCKAPKGFMLDLSRLEVARVLVLSCSRKTTALQVSIFQDGGSGIEMRG